MARERATRAETRRSHALQNETMVEVRALEDTLARQEAANQALRDRIRDMEFQSDVSDQVREVVAMAHDLNAHLVKFSAM